MNCTYFVAVNNKAKELKFEGYKILVLSCSIFAVFDLFKFFHLPFLLV